jgi:hypothetical protein
MFNMNNNNSRPNNTIKGSYISHVNWFDYNSSKKNKDMYI